MISDYMIVRGLKKGDFEPVIKLWLDFFIEDTKDIVKSYLEKKYTRGEFLVAVEGGKIIGFIGFSKDVFYESDYIESIVVNKKFRRSGVAQLLIEEFEKQAIENGRRRVFSSVEPQNRIAVQMHKSLGYEECGYVDHLWDENKRDLFFTKKL